MDLPGTLSVEVAHHRLLRFFFSSWNYNPEAENLAVDGGQPQHRAGRRIRLSSARGAPRRSERSTLRVPKRLEGLSTNLLRKRRARPIPNVDRPAKR